MTEADTRTWLEGFIEVPTTWRVGANQVEMNLGDGEIPVTFKAAHIAALRRRRFPRVRDLVRVPHCGIELSGYAEYLLSFDGSVEWPAKSPLRFKVGEVAIRVGQVSPTLAIICEAIYRSPVNLQEEFFDYSSIQLEGSLSPRDDASVALFYLNADYLRPLKSSARIHHLFDPSGPDPFPFVGKASNILRRRVRVRTRIETLPAIALFNDAATQWGEARFLGFYRVLEFFFRRGALRDFGRMRRDMTVSDAALLSKSRLDRELPQLKALFRAVLTSAETRDLIAFVARRHVSAVKSLEELCEGVYEYRNTIVHAKEAEIDRASIPSQFAPDSVTASWTWVAKTVAERAIRRLS